MNITIASTCQHMTSTNLQIEIPRAVSTCLNAFELFDRQSYSPYDKTSWNSSVRGHGNISLNLNIHLTYTYFYVESYWPHDHSDKTFSIAYILYRVVTVTQSYIWFYLFSKSFDIVRLAALSTMTCLC